MQPNMAYDRAITVFSPDGRLFQVEYAREAVKRGTTTVGVKYKDGVVLVIDKRITSKLIEPDSIEKIFVIDENIGCATSGLVADARVLVDRARVDAQIHRITYGEPPNVEYIVKRICDFKQTYTQYGGVRPFGTALLIAGTDRKGVHLYETDPSGAMMAYKAAAIGSSRTKVLEFFEDNYKEKMSEKAAIELALKALRSASDDWDSSKEGIEIARVKLGGKFEKLPPTTVKKYVSGLKD